MSVIRDLVLFCVVVFVVYLLIYGFADQFGITGLYSPQAVISWIF